MSTANADDLPESVKAEVDKIRQENADPDPQPAEPEEVSPVKISRRAQKEQERQAELSAANERAEAASRALEELNRSRQQDAERLARIEQAMGGLMNLAGQPAQEPEKPDKPSDVADKVRRQMKKAQEALTEGKMDEYHERLSKAIRLETEARLMQKLPQPQQVQQQYAPQKPSWVTAVEMQFPDVVKHERGFNTVAAFAQLDPAPLSADKLERAFGRAREELGLKKRQEEQNGRQRQMLAGGGVNGSRAAAPSKPGTVVNVKLAKGLNHKEIAKRAGMSEADYARAYAAMNPGDVDRE